MKVGTLVLYPASVIAAVSIGLVFDSMTNKLPASKLANATPQPVEESMHEFMEYVFQPTYKRLKVSMAAEPKDNAGWKPIKADALSLAENANLLLIRTPDEGGEVWDQFSVAVRGTGGQLYQAARKRNYSMAQKSYAAMLNNCNACHKEFAGGKYQLQP